jgi:hypothetical protein
VVNGDVQNICGITSIFTSGVQSKSLTIFPNSLCSQKAFKRTKRLETLLPFQHFPVRTLTYKRQLYVRNRMWRPSEVSFSSVFIVGQRSPDWEAGFVFCMTPLRWYDLAVHVLWKVQKNEEGILAKRRSKNSMQVNFYFQRDFRFSMLRIKIHCLLGSCVT